MNPYPDNPFAPNRRARRARSPGAARRSQGAGDDYGPAGSYSTRPPRDMYRPTSIQQYQDTAPTPPLVYERGPPPSTRPLASPKLSAMRPPRAPDPPALNIAPPYGSEKPVIDRDRRYSLDSRREEREDYRERYPRDRDDRERYDRVRYDGTRDVGGDERREREQKAREQRPQDFTTDDSLSSEPEARRRAPPRKKSTKPRSSTAAPLKEKSVRSLPTNLPGRPGPPSSLTTLAELSPSSPPTSTLAPSTNLDPPTPSISPQSKPAGELDQKDQPSKQLVRFSSEIDRAATVSTPPQLRFQSEAERATIDETRSDVQSLVDELRDKSILLRSILSPATSRRGPSPSKKAHRLSTGPAIRDPSTIIYRLSCRDLTTQEELLRYSTTPFEGFIESHGNTRTELAPMDVMLYIQGNKLKDRKSQHRSTFGTNRDPDPDPFVVGEDFFARIIDPAYIRILSPRIQNVLRKLVQYYPGHDLQGSELLFKEPYRVLVHYHDDLHEVADAYDNEDRMVILGSKAKGSLISVKCDETTHDHLNIMLNSPTYKGHYEGVIEPELRNYENGYASYDMLWLLFKPGDTVFARVRKDLAGFVVLAANHTPDPYGVLPLDKWTIQVWNLAYTGQRLTRQAHEFTIDRYSGLYKIDELNIFPKQFLKDDGKVENELIARGAEYFKIVCGLPAHRRYAGSVIANHLVQYNGEIVVDPSGYLTCAPKRGSSRDSSARSATQQRARQPIEKSQIPEDEEADFYTQFTKPLDLDGGPRWSKFNDMVCNEKNMPTPDQLLLFSSHVLGFALQRKEWMIFEMKYVYPVDEDKQAMKRVILEQSEREMLMGMIGDDSIDSWNAESIEGRGRGQVILLYGPPGTGKTFTVECVAKHTNRPLLSLTVADLGTEETTMEAKLAKWLDRATSWNGIVLIDEADIYLERREKEDLSRNSLVTAFLRTMEYYSGTMFLTTNRPSAIDPAFTSRIHLFLGYKTLTPSSRPQVWDGFFNKLEREQRKLRPGVRRLNIPSFTQNFAKDDPMMLELSLNGREIRNILQSAINLARYHARGEGDDEIDITADLLRKVVENRTQYKNAIKAIDGLSESARAHDSKWIAE